MIIDSSPSVSTIGTKMALDLREIWEALRSPDGGG